MNGPETVIEFTMIVPVLLFETVTLCTGLELVTVTLPKLSELLDKASTRSAEGCATFALVYPAQAESIARRKNSIARQVIMLNLFPVAAGLFFENCGEKRKPTFCQSRVVYSRHLLAAFPTRSLRCAQ